MRIFIVIFLALFMPLSFADQAMSEEEMMQRGQAIQECFAKIDPASFDELQSKGAEMEGEIRALCQAGKRDEAMRTAMKYGKEFSDSPEIQEMRKCSELMQGMMAGMPKTYMPPEVDEDGDGGHICDDM